MRSVLLNVRYLRKLISESWMNMNCVDGWVPVNIFFCAWTWLGYLNDNIKTTKYSSSSFVLSEKFISWSFLRGAQLVACLSLSFTSWMLNEVSIGLFLQSNTNFNVLKLCWMDSSIHFSTFFKKCIITSYLNMQLVELEILCRIF